MLPFLPRAAGALLTVTAVSACTAGIASAIDDSCPQKRTNAGCEWSTPGTYTWTVPDGKTQLHILIAGATGGGANGGGGGFAEANLEVTPGEKLQLKVGGRGRWGGEGLSGGWGGGGEAADWLASRGSGGGGGTEISTTNKDGNPLKLMVVGGGGGATSYPGGGGGGINQNGTDGAGVARNHRLAGGATPSTGGVGAIGAGRAGCTAPSGSEGQGANGASCHGNGGGGGGGMFGGGGGTEWGSGGGGSGYGSEAVTGARWYPPGGWRANNGNGQINIYW